MSPRRRRAPALPAELRDYVEGVLDEALSALHAAVAGDELALRRVTARADDPRLLAYVLALQAGHALNVSGRPGPLLADIGEHIDDPDHHHEGDQP